MFDKCGIYNKVSKWTATIPDELIFSWMVVMSHVNIETSQHQSLNLSDANNKMQYKNIPESDRIELYRFWDKFFWKFIFAKHNRPLAEHLPSKIFENLDFVILSKQLNIYHVVGLVFESLNNFC